MIEKISLSKDGVNKGYLEVKKELEALLKEKCLYDLLYYFKADYEPKLIYRSKKTADKPLPEFKTVSIYALPGGNEGAIVYIDLIGTDNKRVYAYWGKTLGTLKDAIAIVKVLTEAIYEEGIIWN